MFAVRITDRVRDAGSDRRVDDGPASQAPRAAANAARFRRTAVRMMRAACGTLPTMRRVSVQRAGNRQRKRRDRNVEREAVLREHLVRAAHRADRRRDAGAARVFEALARLQHRLLAHDPLPADFLDPLLGVGDDPVPADELRGDAAGVRLRDRVGELDVTLVRVRLFGKERDFRRDRDLVAFALRHDVSYAGFCDYSIR